LRRKPSDQFDVIVENETPEKAKGELGEEVGEGVKEMAWEIACAVVRAQGVQNAERIGRAGGQGGTDVLGKDTAVANENIATHDRFKGDTRQEDQNFADRLELDAHFVLAAGIIRLDREKHASPLLENNEKIASREKLKIFDQWGLEKARADRQGSCAKLNCPCSDRFPSRLQRDKMW
jgi:hypothetical protein